MSIREIMVTDQTSIDYGKIGRQFIPDGILPSDSVNQVILSTGTLTIPTLHVVPIDASDNIHLPFTWNFEPTDYIKADVRICITDFGDTYNDTINCNGYIAPSNSSSSLGGILHSSLGNPMVIQAGITTANTGTAEVNVPLILKSGDTSYMNYLIIQPYPGATNAIAKGTPVNFDVNISSSLADTNNVILSIVVTLSVVSAPQ